MAAPGTIGVALRRAGPDDHYLFALDGTAWTLVPRRGGVSTPLRSAPYPLPPGEWHEIVAEAVGTRLRVVVDGEDRAFQGATVLRLPGEGVDLRLLDPAAVVRHARRFVPDAAFVAEPDVGLLRSADATGLALVRAGGLAPGAYRLAWTFRRDNTAADPSSVVLRRHGDDGPEQVVLDLRVGP